MRLLACVISLLFAAPGLAAAQESPVVVEFFTSQGCVTCPPADELFAEFAQQEGVVALALHVTYWDYLGWTDTFARPENDKRQKSYALLMRQRTLFTPQMIIQGQDMVVGRDGKTIADRIAAHRGVPETVRLSAEREGDGLRIAVAPVAEGVGRSDIHLVPLIPSAEVKIGAGVNAGQTIRYTNIVDDWKTIGQWDGGSEMEFEIDPVPSGPLAVLVQRHGFGPMLNASIVE